MDEIYEKICNIFFKISEQPVDKDRLDEILNIQLDNGKYCKWNPEEALELSHRMVQEIGKEKHKRNLFVGSVAIKAIEITKLKYYAYIQQHPEKYGEVDPDKFSAQVESYFSQSLLDKVSQQAEEERKPNTEKSAG